MLRFLKCFLMVLGLTAAFSGVAAQETGETQRKANLDSAAYWTGQGNFEVMQAVEDSTAIDRAIDFYMKARRLAPEEEGVLLNLGIIYLMIDDTLSADEMFGDAYELSGGSFKTLFAKLGLHYEGDEATSRAGARNVTEAEVMAAMITSGKKRASKSGGSKDVKKGGKKRRGAKSGGKKKRFLPEELKPILFWFEPGN